MPDASFPASRSVATPDFGVRHRRSAVFAVVDVMTLCHRAFMAPNHLTVVRCAHLSSKTAWSELSGANGRAGGDPVVPH